MLLVSKVAGIALHRIVGVLWRPALSTCLMVVCLIGLKTGYLPGLALGSVVELLVVIGAGALVYSLTALGLFWMFGSKDCVERYLLDLAEQRLLKR